MSSAETFVTCRNWQGLEICDLGGSGLVFFVCFLVLFRPGADSAMFSGLLISRSTFCQKSIAAVFESKLNPIILLWSVARDKLARCQKQFQEGFFSSKQKADKKDSHHSKGTWYEMRLQKPYSWISCRSYLSTRQSKCRAQPTQRSHAVNFDSWLILYRTWAREHPCRSDANPFSLRLRISWPAMSWCKSVKRLDLLVVCRVCWLDVTVHNVTRASTLSCF